ncbi:MAG: cytochrome b N-terminal domain-containing protein [Armatimonadetes bacterium]|nr:cytochrome b N-terminal domain-containing protein [Armatimonadota bacterium]
MSKRVLTPEQPIEQEPERTREEQLVADRPRLRDWLELRLGWWGFVRKNLDEKMPAGVGWWQTLGNLLLTLLVFQFSTGIALAMYYSPSPESAHASIQHINDGLYFWGINVGIATRSLHVWGSTAIICVTVIHILRVFFWGSYKKPRELTWLIGVLIFFVMLAFSFTGYLLPWDQTAYWATVVGTNIAGTVPVIGDALLVLIRGGHEVGSLTLTRFYAIHVMLLPGALLFLTGLHLMLVRKHHIAGPVKPQKGPGVPFFPVQLFKDAVVVLFGVGLVVYLAAAFPPGLEAMADPSGTDFAPRPEWYYLGLFELLKIMPAGWEVLATVVVPGIVSLGMIFLPWLDRSDSRHPAMRQWIIVTGTFIILMIGLMTLKGILDTPVHAEPEQVESAVDANVTNLADDVDPP